MSVSQVVSFLLLVWNCLAFVLYGLDKGKARKGQYRIPERTLLASALFLGGLGSLFGGQFFHHKTKKWYFQLTWWVGTLLLVGVLYWIWFILPTMKGF